MLQGGVISAAGSGSLALQAVGNAYVYSGAVMVATGGGQNGLVAYVSSAGWQTRVFGGTVFGVGQSRLDILGSGHQEGLVTLGGATLWLPPGSLPDSFTEGAAAPVQSFPAGATGVWALQGGIGGIAYTTVIGNRSGFIPIFFGLNVNRSLSVKLHGGTGGPGFPAAIPQTAWTIAPTTPAPTRAGYTFGGWALTDGGAAVTQVPAGTTDVTLHALWTPISNGGNGNGNNNGGKGNNNVNNGGNGNGTPTPTPAFVPTPVPARLPHVWVEPSEALIVYWQEYLEYRFDDMEIVVDTFLLETPVGEYVSVNIKFVEGGEELPDFNAYFTIFADLYGFVPGEQNYHRIVAFAGDKLIGGGIRDAEMIFSVPATEPELFTIAYVETLKRLTMQLDSAIIYDLAGNAQMQVMDVLPVIVDGRTLVPIRFVAYALGADVDWTQATDYRPILVHITINDETLTFGLGEITPQLAALGMDVPAITIDDRTMVPLRFVSEFFGALVEWDGVTQGIGIIRDAAPTAETDDNE